MRGRILGFGAALFIHAAILLFGGLLFLKEEETGNRTIRDVDLVEEAREEKQEPKKEPEPDAAAEEAPLEESQERPPDVAEELSRLESEAQAPALPALEALSLGDLASLLDPGAVGAQESFGGSFGLQSGGRIGGTGASGAAGGTEEGAGPDSSIFTIADLDQRPRPLFQPSPIYPHELRSKRSEGTVYVLFVVDAEGSVMDPRVERSTHQAFERPALEAIRQWKFEPATRQGQKVSCRIRVPIRFTV